MFSSRLLDLGNSCFCFSLKFVLVYIPYSLLKVAFLKFEWGEKRISCPALVRASQARSKFPSRLLPNEKLGFPMRAWEEGLSSFNLCFLGYIFTPSNQKILAWRKLCALPSPAGLHPPFSIMQQLIHLLRILLAHLPLWHCGSASAAPLSPERSCGAELIFLLPCLLRHKKEDLTFYQPQCNLSVIYCSVDGRGFIIQCSSRVSLRDTSEVPSVKPVCYTARRLLPSPF